MQTKLLIASGDSGLGLGLSDRIAQETACDLSIFTTEIEELQATAAFILPNVILIEYESLRDRTHEVLAPLLRLPSAPRVLFLCDACPRELLLTFIMLGACGCFLHSDPPGVVANAARSVHEGATWFGRSSLVSALRSLVGTLPEPPHSAEEGQLTPREKEVFSLIGRGLTNKEIARSLKISDNTVKTHLHRVYVKLHRSGRYKALLSPPSRLSH